MRWTCQSRETGSQATVRVGRPGARPRQSEWGDREPGHCQSGETGSQATVRVGRPGARPLSEWGPGHCQSGETVSQATVRVHAIHELKADKV